MAEQSAGMIEVRDYQGERIEVVFRKAAPIDVSSPPISHSGFNPLRFPVVFEASPLL
jgi:hypothetical protein